MATVEETKMHSRSIEKVMCWASSQDVTAVTSDGSGAVSAAISSGLRNCPYLGLPGVETSTAHARARSTGSGEWVVQRPQLRAV